MLIFHVVLLDVILIGILDLCVVDDLVGILLVMVRWPACNSQQGNDNNSCYIRLPIPAWLWWLNSRNPCCKWKYVRQALIYILCTDLSFPSRCRRAHNVLSKGHRPNTIAALFGHIHFPYFLTVFIRPIPVTSWPCMHGCSALSE